MNFEQLKHCMTGAVRSSLELAKMAKEKDENVSLPGLAEVVKNQNRLERSLYNLHAQQAKWNLAMIEEIEKK